MGEGAACAFRSLNQFHQDNGTVPAQRTLALSPKPAPMKSDSSLTMKDAVGDRAEALFREQREEVYRETDQFLARLLLLEWVALIVVAFFVTPGDWRTQVGRIEWHVWKVIALGGTVRYFVDHVFNYPTLAECYKVAALAGLNKLPLGGAAIG